MSDFINHGRPENMGRLLEKLEDRVEVQQLEEQVAALTEACAAKDRLIALAGRLIRAHIATPPDEMTDEDWRVLADRCEEDLSSTPSSVMQLTEDARIGCKVKALLKHHHEHFRDYPPGQAAILLSQLAEELGLTVAGEV